MLYVHVAENHARAIPEAILAAGRDERAVQSCGGSLLERGCRLAYSCLIATRTRS
jgi:hypothetical protein